MTRLRHPAVAAALVAALVAVTTTLLRSELGGGPLELLERWVLDLRFVARGPAPVSSDLTLVVFDDATVGTGELLFERRAGWAKVVRAVAASGAKVIGVDAVFDQPERLLSPELSARIATWREGHPTLPPGDEAALLAETARELDGDGELEAALREAGNVVLILFAGEGDPAPGLDTSLARGRYAQSTLAAVPPPSAPRVVASLPRLTAAAKALGFANVDEDPTRTVRRMSLAVSHGEGVYLPFAVAAAAQYLGLGRGRLAYLGPQQQVKLGDRPLALDRDGVWLDYRGPSGSYPSFSARDVVAGKVPREALQGKLVLIGVTRFGYDLARTPFGFMPGLEVQATAVDQVLRGQGLQRTSRTVDLLVTLALGLAIAALFASRRPSPGAQIAGAVLLLGGWVVGSQWAFVRWSTWAPLIGPAVAVLACALTGLALSYAAEATQRRALRRAFGHYVGDEVLDELLAAPNALELGGERRRLTVLFSDIRDFTTFSEALPAERLVQVLNTYLSPMTRAVLAKGGMLDKYIGDAVMAVFGAPLKREDHADQALRCALEMHRELEALNRGPLKELGLEFSIGVGVNTGEMVVGNMGAETRFNYTVAGDAVNLASRLEGLTKHYGVFCLVGDGSRSAASGDFRFRALDLVQVKGKHEAITVWELLAGPDREVARYERLDAWEAAVTAFRAGKLADARAHFARFSEVNPDDVAVKLYLERLAALPPEAPPDFSPVTVFTTK
ncbi:MAG: adenylate/guanylate cyclase domain-containing protein [Myxococcota bacterium]